MLITCPECLLQMSDKALACPHCGYQIRKISSSKSKRRRRLPNGFGQISELKGQNLRKPFRVMVSVGKTNEGRPICRMLKPEAYFETYNEAYQALVEYHRNPYELDSVITLEELYDRWSEQYFKTLKSDSSRRTIVAAWNRCKEISDMRVRDIRARHIKACMEKTDSPNIRNRVKSLFNLLLDYAVEYELADKNYARTFSIGDSNISNESKRAHIPFADWEMDLLWKNISFPYVEIVLLQCYSGWRPQELGLLRLENISLEEDYLIGGMKTEAGTNRKVPIHPLIRPIVERLCREATELGSEYLINCTDTATHKASLFFSYDKYQKRFIKIRDRPGLNPDHRAHDGRVHFVTMAKKYNLDEYAIKYIVGHHVADITEKVYTRREFEWLATEMKKIK